MTLIEAGILQGQGHWTKGASARDSQGIPCLSTSGRAVSWCLAGELDRLTERMGIGQIFRCVNAIAGTIMRLFPNRGNPKEGLINRITMFNDHPATSYDDVRRVLEQAHTEFLIKALA